MRPGAHAVLRAAASFYAPLILLFALALLAVRLAGDGVGLLAGLAVALVFALHIVVAGAAAARAAFPPVLARALMSLGLATALIGAGAQGLAFGAQLVEAGLFALTAAGSALIFMALAGRAPTMRDEDW